MHVHVYTCTCTLYKLLFDGSHILVYTCTLQYMYRYLEVDILQLLVVLLQLSLVLVESGEVVLDPLLQLEGLELATHGRDEAVL